MKKNEVTLIDIFRYYINSNIGICIYRSKLLSYVSSVKNTYFSETYIDGTRRMLVVCGYLEYTGYPGEYRCIRQIPHDTNYNQLRIEYNELIKDHKDDYIGNSKTITNKYIK